MRLSPLLLSLAAAAPLPAQAGVRFTDITSTSGISVTHNDAIDTMGGGVCFLDYDNDGDPDLFVAQRGGGTNVLYRNDGNGKFTDVSKKAGIDAKWQTMGAYAADFDNDGWQDLLVLAFGLVLYRNNHDGTFTDVTKGSGLADVAWETSATFGDYDRDGRIDIYIGNYIGDGFYPFVRGSTNRLYHNDGKLKFTDVTQRAGVSGFERFWDIRGYWRSTYGCTLSVLFHDYDRDGWPDLFVGNDFGPWIIPNQLFRNNHDGTFTEVGAQAGFRVAEFNMGIATADVNGDLIPDIYTTNLGNNHLLLSDGKGALRDVAQLMGASEGHSRGKYLTSWACFFLDADLDARRDLYVSNGYIQTVPALDNERQAPSRLLQNLGRSFVHVPATAFPWDTRVGRGAARADIDGDGDEDIVQLNNKAKLGVYRNDSVTKNRAFVLDLEGTTSNRDAIGAFVTARGARFTQALEYDRGGSYASCNGAPIVLGLAGDPRVEELAVRWPSGATSRRYGLAGDRRHRVIEPRVTIVSLGTAQPFGTDYVMKRVVLHNHAATASAVRLSARLRWYGRRFDFPALHLPVSVAAKSRSTATLYLPIAPAALPLARQLGLWLQVTAATGGKGIDQVEQPLR